MTDAPPSVADVVDPRHIHPLVLAHVGDAVYDLHVRTRLATTPHLKPQEIHEKTVALVKASAQAQALEELDAFLTEEERAVVRRGRNAKSGRTPKGVSVGEYRWSTGLEALLGYLHLSGQRERLNEVLTRIKA